MKQNFPLRLFLSEDGLNHPHANGHSVVYILQYIRYAFLQCSILSRRFRLEIGVEGSADDRSSDENNNHVT